MNTDYAPNPIDWVTHHVELIESSGAERETWWERAVSVNPGYADYADYATKTDQVTLVFVLESVA